MVNVCPAVPGITAAQSYCRRVAGLVCRCCGRWRVTVELVRGRYLYRLAHRYPQEAGGGAEVVGEVPTVGALETLLHIHARLTLADLAEVG